MPKIALTNYVLIISAVWLAVALYLGWNAQAPDGCSGTFSCLAANEWGDYLAGVFAPLAFFWLVAAVFVQSKELAEQREELRLTREEFKHNRAVMSAQADEARRQAEFIGLQTEILSRQDEVNRSEQQNAKFDSTLYDLSNLIDLSLTKINTLTGQQKDGTLVGLKFEPGDRTRDQIIREFGRFLSMAATLNRLDPPYFINVPGLPMARRALDLIDQACDLGQQGGLRQTVLIESLQLLPLRASLGKLISNTDAILMSAEAAPEAKTMD